MQTKPKRLLLLLRLTRPIFHILCVIGSYYGMILLRSYTDLIPFVQLRIPQIDIFETMLFSCSVALLFVLLGIFYGLYELFNPIHAYYSKFLKTRFIRLVSSTFLAYMGFGFFFESGISRFVLFFGSLSTLVLVTLCDTLINAINSSLESRHPYRILVLGEPSEITQRVYKVLSLYRIYHVTLTMGSEMSVDETSANDIIIVAGSFSQEILQSTADTARILGKQFYHVSDSFFLEDLIALPQRIGPMMALQYVPSPLDGRWRVTKRLFDLFSASIGLLLLLPLFLVIGILIKLDSPGPVFYMQKRVGKHKKSFTFIKFRTMFTHLSLGENYGGEQAKKMYQDLINSDANVREGILPKIEDDPRVTRVGKFLRKTSLDELPSLISVVRGTMSLVGPRPHLNREVKQYDMWQERLFSIKPGITGYAQLFGRDQLPFEEEARLDLYYIQNRSLALDIYVLFGTLKVIFRGK